MDERYLAVNIAGRGLVVFSACSHAGIINVVQDAATASITVSFWTPAMQATWRNFSLPWSRFHPPQ